MKHLESIIEDTEGNVVGAITSDGPIMLPEGQAFPRSELITRARHLAAAFGVTIPAPLEAVLTDPA